LDFPAFLWEPSRLIMKLFNKYIIWATNILYKLNWIIYIYVTNMCFTNLTKFYFDLVTNIRFIKIFKHFIYKLISFTNLHVWTVLFTQNLKCTCLLYSLHKNNLNNFVTEFWLLSISLNNLFFIIYTRKLQLRLVT